MRTDGYSGRRWDHYRVAGGERDVVRILAVGEKRGNILRIAGKEIRL